MAAEAEIARRVGGRLAFSRDHHCALDSARAHKIARMPRADPPKFKFLKREEGNSRYSKGGLAALRERANSLRAQKPQRDTPSRREAP